MFDVSSHTLLEKKLPALPRVVAEASLKRDVDDLLAGVLPRIKWAVVDDPNTRDVLGGQVFKAVAGHGVRHVTFDSPPAANDTAVEYIRRQSKDCDALAAVGSGTINDICKYAAYLDNKPYVVFPTAASMNGYISANASISFQGYKKTCAAKMPLAVFCDLSVIAGAPPRLSKSGLGDCLARPTAQADWLLSHLLLGTPYDETPFALLAPFEPLLFDNARGVAHHDRETVALLMKVLLLSGLGMTIAGGSYPASQAEHMIAHAYEMRVASGEWRVERNTLGALHGETIGVTTLFMAQRQEKLLRGKPALRTENFPEEKIRIMFGEKVMQEAKKAFAVKKGTIPSPLEGEGKGGGHVVGDAEINNAPPPTPSLKGRGNIDWESIVAQIEKIMLPPSRLQSILEAAECPMTVDALGWNLKDYDEVMGVARFLRERFTFLDLSS